MTVMQLSIRSKYSLMIIIVFKSRKCDGPGVVGRCASDCETQLRRRPILQYLLKR